MKPLVTDSYALPNGGFLLFCPTEDALQRAAAGRDQTTVPASKVSDYLLAALHYSSVPNEWRAMLEALRDRADFVSIDDLAHEIGVSNRKIGSMLGRMSERIALKAPKPLLKSVRTPVLLMIDTIYSKANKASYRLTEAGREAITMFLK